MKEQIQSRLEDLRKEFEVGQAKLKMLEAEQAYTRETLIRIGGAIQVLENILSEASGDAPEAEEGVETPAGIDTNGQAGE